jgi:hypothetical protein
MMGFNFKRGAAVQSAIWCQAFISFIIHVNPANSNSNLNNRLDGKRHVCEQEKFYSLGFNIVK